MAKTRTLKSAPGAGTLYPRAVLGTFAMPLLRKVPLVGPRAATQLPDLQLALDDVEIDPRHVADYAKVCGFDLRDELPATYLHNVAFPLAMALMTDGSFPFGVIGLVHFANRIEQRRPVRVTERPSVRVRAADLRDHPAGRQFDLIGEALVDGEVVWTDTSTYLRPGGGSGRPEGEKKQEDRPERPEPEAIWSVPGDIGRKFGAVSGDRNPIHLHPLTAKAFGMPSAIAHGMWLKARCLAALEPELPDAFAIDVRFKKPVILPAKVGFATARDADGIAFSLWGTRKPVPHLDGRVTFA